MICRNKAVAQGSHPPGEGKSPCPCLLSLGKSSEASWYWWPKCCLQCVMSGDVGDPVQSRACWWISCLLGAVEVQFFREEPCYPIACPSPAVFWIRILDFANTADKSW